MSAVEERCKAIRLNDTTDHGGKVISASTAVSVCGLAVACVGDMVECPKCAGVFPIVEGSSNTWYIDEDGNKRAISIHGDKTACGAKLIAIDFIQGE